MTPLVISIAIDGWYEPSLRRSAIQLLLDDYPGMADGFDMENRESVEEIDETLRDRAPRSTAPGHHSAGAA
ncbi:hypothetical protein ACWEOI_31160 [Nocardia sp. NPDC004340]